MGKSKKQPGAQNYLINPKRLTDILPLGWGLILKHTLIDEDLINLKFEKLFEKIVMKEKSPIYLTKGSYAFCNPSEAQSFAPEQRLNWIPANRIALKMMGALEAVRDLALAMQIPESTVISLRLIKSWSTPLLNLFQALTSIYNDINGNPKRYRIYQSPAWDTFRKMYRRHEIDICAHISPDGTLNLVRDKMHSHIDKEMLASPDLYWPKFNFEVFAEYIVSAVRHLFFLQCLDGVYAWKLDRGTSEIISLTTEEFILANFFIESDGSVTSETDIIYSLKHNLMNEVIPVIEKYNLYVKLANLEVTWFFVIRCNADGTFNISIPRASRVAPKNNKAQNNANNASNLCTGMKDVRVV